MSDSVVNVVQSICETSLLRSSFPNNRNNTNISLFENDERSHELNYLSLTQNLGNNGELHDEDSSHSTNLNIDHNNIENTFNDIFEIKVINESNSNNNKVIDNVNTESDHLESNGSSNFLPWLQDWAIKNRISHVALTELMTRIKPKYSELPTDARSLLRTPRKINVQNFASVKMSDQTWTVVRFIDEDTVEAVPSSWIIQNRCYWPPFKNEKIMAIIRKNEQPNTCWPSYEISIFRNSTFADYKTAREKCKKSEFTSDLNSDVDIRRKQSSKTLSSSEDEDNRTLPMPPVLKLTDAQSKKKNKYRFAFSASKSDDESAEDILAVPQIFNKELPKIKEFHSESSALHEQNDEPSNILGNRISNSAFNNSICTCKRCPIHKDLQNNNDSVIYFKEIIRQQHLFKAEIWQQSDNIRVIKNTLENLHHNTNGNNAEGNTRQQSIFYSCNIPIQNERQLEEQMEDFLKIDENFDTSILEASKVGGKSAYEFVKRTLSQILTNELAAKYSWLGRKNKRVFQTLKLSQLLIAAGEKVNATFTKKDIEEAIQKWLKRAKESKHEVLDLQLDSREMTQTKVHDNTLKIKKTKIQRLEKDTNVKRWIEEVVHLRLQVQIEELHKNILFFKQENEYIRRLVEKCRCLSEDIKSLQQLLPIRDTYSGLTTTVKHLQVTYHNEHGIIATLTGMFRGSINIQQIAAKLLSFIEHWNPRDNMVTSHVSSAPRTQAPLEPPSSMIFDVY
ncbi:PREDICTED: uncharacterized protein LOC105452470 isoform X3 [Wasmannia auropunctata]|uniref:uncharacterized protein LOC105452470 isoform X3 n=1 Tax=Wasmannia auropunctata TaxID=64793 RepID=UPI0005F03047|nr:PREDICTED: uncharacterized protein LOC105452470 isoform X3 [Wasmannia auropunctata]